MTPQANNWPNIPHIRFEKCCQTAILKIRHNHEIGHMINKTVIPLVFLSLFFNPTNPSGQGSGMIMASGIAMTDWVNLYRGVIGLNQFIKNQNSEIARYEAFDHSEMTGNKNNSNLIKFWTAVSDVYSK